MMETIETEKRLWGDSDSGFSNNNSPTGSYRQNNRQRKPQVNKLFSRLLNSSSRTDLISYCHLHFFLVIFCPVFHLARKLENNKSSALEIKRIKLSRNAVVSDSGALTE